MRESLIFSSIETTCRVQDVLISFSFLSCYSIIQLTICISTSLILSPHFFVERCLFLFCNVGQTANVQKCLFGLVHLIITQHFTSLSSLFHKSHLPTFIYIAFVEELYGISLNWFLTKKEQMPQVLFYFLSQSFIILIAWLFAKLWASVFIVVIRD